MGRVQHLMRAGKLYGQLKAARLAREAAGNAEAPNDLHDAHVVAFVATTANMSTRDLLAAGLLWTRPKIFYALIDAFGITNEVDAETPARSRASPTQLVLF